jgi:hypothetical protein
VRNLRGDSVTRSNHDHFVDQADEARGIGMANVASFVKPVEMSRSISFALPFDSPRVDERLSQVTGAVDQPSKANRKH